MAGAILQIGRPAGSKTGVEASAEQSADLPAKRKPRPTSGKAGTAEKVRKR